jgi:hypothetical protein
MKKSLLEAIVFVALSATIACQPGRRVDDGAAQNSPADSCSASFQAWWHCRMTSITA